MQGESPEARLERVFANIAATRMADVPILNPALRVETVGFRPWQGYWIGVLVTPWTINLVLLPGDEAPLKPLLLDQKQQWVFPSGAYEFMGLNQEELGTCHICPLLSPVMEFATHEQAVAVASEIAEALFSEPQREDSRAGQLAGMVEEARLKGESIANKQVSRRDFLRTPFLGR
jgi:[NiFe] hydrogenase assembly HybE family chaperone